MDAHGDEAAEYERPRVSSDLKSARTIADLAESEQVETQHLAEADAEKTEKSGVEYGDSIPACKLLTFPTIFCWW